MGEFKDAARFGFPSCLSLAGILFASLFAWWCRSFQFDGTDFTLSDTDGGVVVLPSGTSLSVTLPPNVSTVSVRVGDLRLSPWYATRISPQDVQLDTTDRENPVITILTQDDNCVTYGEDEDAKWNFVKAATVIVVTIGGILFFVMCLGPFFRQLHVKTWLCVALTYILLLTTLQGLTFLIYSSNACNDNPLQRRVRNSVLALLDGLNVTVNITDPERTSTLWDEDCSWDVGSAYSIVAACCWLLAGLVMIVLDAPGSDSPPPETEASSVKELREEQAPESDDRKEYM